MDENRVTYFAETDARNKRVKFGIKSKDRTKHLYVIGKTGMGKSTMLENMAVQDIQAGEGMCFIDPHGKTADLLMEYVPKERVRDVIHIAPFDIEYPISFNVLESVDPDKRHLVVSGLMSTFKKIWVDAWSARMEYILTNTLLALLEVPDATLLGVNKLLSDKDYRREIVAKVQDPGVRSFWTKEFANYSERMAQDAVPAIQNKVGQFTANPLIRNMIGQPQSSFDFRKAMDERKIIIINLSKGRIGDENMKLLGGMLVTKIYLAAMSRADTPDRVLKTLPNFYLFVDEFQNFANASFADILSEARKYKLNLTIAHQYIEQMDETVSAAVFGNVGTMIVFRVGATDAEMLEKEFAPTFTIEDLVNLGFAQIYLKLMIDGLTSPPFSATTLPPIAQPETSFVKEIIEASREQFARPRAAVEAEIVKFHEAIAKPMRPTQTRQAQQTQWRGGTNMGSADTPSGSAVNERNATASPAAGSRLRPGSGTLNPSSGVGSEASASPMFASAAPAQTAGSVSAPAPASAAPRSVANMGSEPVKEAGGNRTPHASHTPPRKAIGIVGEGTHVREASGRGPLRFVSHQPRPSLPLSALNRNNPKSDPKVQSKENVNQLREALQAAMKSRDGSASPSEAPQERRRVAESVAAANVPTKPNEVPEDVLKKVLKVD